MNISVVIPNWNGKNLLAKYLPLIVKEKSHEIIVVDDNSADGSVEFIKKFFPNVKLIVNKTNKNFAFTVNTGVKFATGELVCILNNDVKPYANFLKNTIKYFNDPLLFGVSLHEVGSGPSVSTFREGFVGYQRGLESINSQKTFWISGGSCVVRKKLWDDLGGFDYKNFPYYWEDLDISYRAVKKGFNILWVPDSKVEHVHETSYKNKYNEKKMNFEKEKRQLLFMWKNITDKDIAQKHVIGLLKRCFHSPGYIKIVVASMFHLQGILKYRNSIGTGNKLNDAEVLKLSS